MHDRAGYGGLSHLLGGFGSKSKLFSAHPARGNPLPRGGLAHTPGVAYLGDERNALLIRYRRMSVGTVID